MALSTGHKVAIGGSGAATIGVASILALVALGSGIDLVTFSITPNDADTTSAADSVVCTMELTDTDGIESTGCVLISPTGRKTSCISFVQDSGTAEDGIWSCPAPFVELSESGTWTVDYVFARDTLGNSERATNADLVADIPNVIPDAAELDVAVTSPSADDSPPQITAFAVNPVTVDLSVDDSLKCDITVSDSGSSSGIKDAGCTWLGPSGVERISCLTSAASQGDDVYSCTMQVPPGDLGTWSLVNIFGRDNSLNLTRFSGSEVNEVLLAPNTFEAIPGTIGFPVRPQGPATTCTLDAPIGAACICEGTEYGSGYCCALGFSWSACSPTEVYAKAVGTGAGDGSDWANAETFDSTSLVRDRVYWIAAGDYGTAKQVFSTPASASLGITIRKATEASHGTDTGWSSSLGDGQAVFGQLEFTTGRYTLDGGEWDGIRTDGEHITENVSEDHRQVEVNAENFIVLRHIEIDGGVTVDGGNNQLTGTCTGIQGGGDFQVFDRLHIHDTADDGYQANGTQDVTITNSLIHALPACGTDAACTGGCFNGHSDAIEIYNGNGFRVLGNFVYDITLTGALITGDTGSTSGFVMENNIFYTNTGGVMTLRALENPKIYNNIIWGYTQGTRFGGTTVMDGVNDLEFFGNVTTNINFTHFGSAGYNPVEHSLGYNQFGVLDKGANEYPGSVTDQEGDPLFLGIPFSSVEGDHDFVNATLEDFSFQPSSPAIDQAGPVGPDWDIIAVSRPLGVRDIGAFEVLGAGGAGGTGGSGGAGGAAGSGGTGGAGGNVCDGKTPDLSATAAWNNSTQQTAATAALTFETYAKTSLADSLVTVSSIPVTTFGDAAMLVRFDTDGFFDVRDAGVYSCDNCAVPWFAGLWYKITITADVAAGTYSVDIGQCDDTQTRVITDALFRTAAPVAGGMDYYSIWSNTGTVDLEGVTWNGVCTPTTCGALGYNCDLWSDGCGGQLNCGTCGGGDVCNAGVCCTPSATVCTDPDPDYECGDWSDGCGGTVNCGSCGAGDVCNGSGQCVPAAVGDCSCGSVDPGNPCTGQSASYTRDGQTITFNFDCGGGDCKCGQFATGWDYWVAPQSPGGTVTVTSMTPNATGGGTSFSNGAQFGPTTMQTVQGMDGSDFFFMKSYQSSKTKTPPFGVTPSAIGRPETILKSISNDSLCNSSSRVCFDYIETLTVVDTPPGNVFRPSFFGTNKTMYSAASFDDSFLSELAPVSGAPSWDGALNATLSPWFQRGFDNYSARTSYAARININGNRGYHGFTARTSLQALLKLTEAVSGADVAKKEQLAKQIVQQGIDAWAVHDEGDNGSFHVNHIAAGCGAWIPNGGHNFGMLAPILYANALLGQSWHTTMNATLSSLAGKTCFAETGMIMPASVTASGKNVPLFGHRAGNTTGVFSFGTGTNCNNVNENWLTDGNGQVSCGCPTVYQGCCTQGHMLATGLSVWLTPRIFNQYPANAQHLLDYIARARSLAGGAEFAFYCNAGNFSVTTRSDTGYDSSQYYNLWDTYDSCGMRGTQNCTGLGSP